MLALPASWLMHSLPNAAADLQQTVEFQELVTVAGQVEAALALASAVLQGGDLTSALQAVAAHLGKQAARMQLQQPAGLPRQLATIERLSQAVTQ